MIHRLKICQWIYLWRNDELSVFIPACVACHRKISFCWRGILLTQESYASGCFSLEIFCIKHFNRDEIPIRLHDRGCKIIYREMRHFYLGFSSQRFLLKFMCWIHFVIRWARVAHICVSNTKIIGSDNGLLPVRRQAIIWSNAGISIIGP